MVLAGVGAGLQWCVLCYNSGMKLNFFKILRLLGNKIVRFRLYFLFAALIVISAITVIYVDLSSRECKECEPCVKEDVRNVNDDEAKEGEGIDYSLLSECTSKDFSEGGEYKKVNNTVKYFVNRRKSCKVEITKYLERKLGKDQFESNYNKEYYVNERDYSGKLNVYSFTKDGLVRCDLISDECDVVMSLKNAQECAYRLENKIRNLAGISYRFSDFFVFSITMDSGDHSEEYLKKKGCNEAGLYIFNEETAKAKKIL